MSDVLFYDLIDTICSQSSDLLNEQSIGCSREGRPINAFVFGEGKLKVSLIAGCHGDEPVGPLLLTKIVNYLSCCEFSSDLLKLCTFYIIPDANPDAHARNSVWWDSNTDYCNFWKYLTTVSREALGDDVEFGFPQSADGQGIRVENTSIAKWWIDQGVSFDIHASLHGMGFAAGPWFLLGDNWTSKSETLRDKCSQMVERSGYRVHDVERNGEKGFVRIGAGFCTCPNSKSIQKFFVERDEEGMASKCYPSSMEFMCSINPDCFTLVTEMPLFILPDVGLEIGPPDKAAEEWKERFLKWKNQGEHKQVMDDANEHGLRPMSISDQMRLQWFYICSAINCVADSVRYELTI